MKDNKKTLILNKIIGLIAFLTVSVVMGAFLIVTSLNYFKPLSNSFFLLTIFILFWVFIVIKKGVKSFKTEKEYPKFKEFFIILLVILISTLLTNLGYQYLKLYSVVSASLVSLSFGLFMKKYGPEATVGAFLGVSYFNLIYYELLIAVLIASAVFYGLKIYFNGHGGKLGLTAFSGAFIAFLLTKEKFTPTMNYQNIEVLYIMIISIVAALITNIINNKFKLGPIVSYSLVSLLGVLIFNNFEYTYNLAFAKVVFGASFIGMGSKQINSSQLKIILIALIYSLLLTLNLNFDNVGGRLGSLAIISLFIAEGLIYVFTNNYKIVQKSTFNLVIHI